ncbi:EamA family transporter [Candidatus Woesebacteria bacterium]|nr:EamA family transporter [Candidatus Woesebacteria bacterium]
MNATRIQTVAPFLVACAAIVWSFDDVLRRELYTLSPLVLVFLEHLFGLTLLLLTAPRWLSEIKTVSRKNWMTMTVVAFFSGLLGTVLYTAALGKVEYIQYSVVVLLQQLQPLFVVVLARFMLKEQVNKQFYVWLVLALIGAYLLSFPTLTLNTQGNTATLLAALMALGAAACWGSSTVISKMVLNTTSALTSTVMRFGLTTVMAGILVVLLGKTPELLSVTAVQMQAILLIALSAGMVGLLIYYTGLKHTPARVATLFELLWPVSAVAIDYMYFDKTLTNTQFLGAGLVFFSLWRVQISRRST